MPNLFTLVLQLSVVLAVCRLVGEIFQKIHQPQVMGEMFAGIMLGPSLLGWLAPIFRAQLFPPCQPGLPQRVEPGWAGGIHVSGGPGVESIGTEGYGHAAVLTSHVSIWRPFVLGGLLALYLYPRLSDDSVTFTGFALFMGAAMSITAFPVLARILTEREHGREPAGHAGDRLRGGRRRDRMVHPRLYRGVGPLRTLRALRFG